MAESNQFWVYEKSLLSVLCLPDDRFEVALGSDPLSNASFSIPDCVPAAYNSLVFPAIMAIRSAPIQPLTLAGFLSNDPLIAAVLLVTESCIEVSSAGFSHRQAVSRLWPGHPCVPMALSSVVSKSEWL